MATQHTEKQQILDWLAASQGDMLQLLELSLIHISEPTRPTT